MGISCILVYFTVWVLLNIVNLLCVPKDDNSTKFEHFGFTWDKIHLKLNNKRLIKIKRNILHFTNKSKTYHTIVERYSYDACMSIHGYLWFKNRIGFCHFLIIELREMWPCYPHLCYKTHFLFAKSWGPQSWQKIKVWFLSICVLCATLWEMGPLRAL